jgi:hypothetical protein
MENSSKKNITRHSIIIFPYSFCAPLCVVDGWSARVRVSENRVEKNILPHLHNGIQAENEIGRKKNFERGARELSLSLYFFKPTIRAQSFNSMRD